jgi:hypothetical protein
MSFFIKKKKKERKETIRHLVSPFKQAIALLGIMGSNVISPLTQSGRVSKLACKKFHVYCELGFFFKKKKIKISRTFEIREQHQFRMQ